MRSGALLNFAAIAVAAALLLSACQSQTPSSSSPDDELSPLVPNASPCPYGMLANIQRGFVDPVSEVGWDEFTGPAGYPDLTKGYQVSCAFRFTMPDGIVVVAYFMGMGPEFVLTMADRLKKHGFTLVSSNDGLPREWVSGGVELQVRRLFANDISVSNTTFTEDFVTITFNE